MNTDDQLPHNVDHLAIETSTAHAAASALREEILAINRENIFLGSEDDLIRRVGVSRPTLRQAARILESDQLLTVRRGVNGGFFTRLPESAAVAELASVFLRSRGTTVVENMEATSFLAVEAARRAAAHPSVARRTTLLDFVTSGWADRPGRSGQVHRLATEFPRQLARITERPTLVLFMDILMEVAVAPLGVRFFSSTERIEETKHHQFHLAELVKAGDVELAEAEMRRHLTLVTAWTEESWRGAQGRKRGRGPVDRQRLAN